MRHKDVKGTESTVRGRTQDSSSDSVSLEREDEAEYTQKTRQGTINLVGFDAARVSETSMYQNIFLLALCKMFMLFAFLALLIG
jgi:hypothetical protein